MTSEHEQDRERLRKYIVREGLISMMNDSTWRAAIEALSSIPGYRPRFRVRCVRDSETQVPAWDQSFPEHVPTFVEIEWLEVDPIFRRQSGAVAVEPDIDFGAAIAAALIAAHVQFREVGGALRIVGYDGPTPAPPPPRKDAG